MVESRKGQPKAQESEDQELPSSEAQEPQQESETPEPGPEQQQKNVFQHDLSTPPGQQHGETT